MVSIDGTDMPVESSKKLFSHKFQSNGLKYEVGVCTLTGDVVWINGPFICPEHDISVARMAVIGSLDPNEMLEADGGYRGEDEIIKTPHPHHIRSQNEKEMKRVLRSRHETVNKRFKHFAILTKRFRHDLGKHSASFRAVAVVTQMNIKNGQPLFQVTYYDDK